MRCEGWRKPGSFMTFGPRHWEQCSNEAIVMIKFERKGENQILPACAQCWQDCIDNRDPSMRILEVTPILKEVDTGSDMEAEGQ